MYSLMARADDESPPSPSSSFVDDIIVTLDDDDDDDVDDRATTRSTIMPFVPKAWQEERWGEVVEDWYDARDAVAATTRRDARTMSSFRWEVSAFFFSKEGRF